MQKTLISQPVFTWQYTKVYSLYCGKLFLAEIQFHKRDNGNEYYQVKHAAFLDTLTDTLPGYKDCSCFYLTGKTFAEISEMVEQFYTTIFAQMDFTMTLQ
jgi:hypothetical protein